MRGVPIYRGSDLSGSCNTTRSLLRGLRVQERQCHGSCGSPVQTDSVLSLGPSDPGSAPPQSTAGPQAWAPSQRSRAQSEGCTAGPCAGNRVTAVSSLFRDNPSPFLPDLTSEPRPAGQASLGSCLETPLRAQPCCPTKDKPLGPPCRLSLGSAPLPLISSCFLAPLPQFPSTSPAGQPS